MRIVKTGNRTHGPGVRVVISHKPTGAVATASGRSVHEAKRKAMRLLRSMLEAEPLPMGRVRTYDIESPAGTFIRDERTKEVFRGGDVMLAVMDGKLELVRGIACPSPSPSATDAP